MHRFARLITLLLALLMVSSVSAQAGGDGFFRFVHAIPSVGNVDVYVDDTLVVTDLAYGEGSNYLSVAEGTRQLTVRPTGLTTELWRQPVNAQAGLPLTLIASSIDPLEFQVFEDDFSPVTPGTTRFRIVHAIDGAPAVDVTYDEQPVASGLNYGELSGGYDVEAGLYPLTVSADGEALVSDAPFPLTTNTAYFVILYGTPNDPQALTLSAPVFAAEDAGFVRVAHAVPDAPAVDIYTDDILIIPALAFGDVTEHLQLPPGTYPLELRAAGTDESLLEATLSVEAGVALTLAAIGSVDDLAVSVFDDDVSAITPQTAVVSVINTIPESDVSLVLGDGTTLADALAYDSISDAVALAPVSDFATLTLTLDDASQDVAVPVTDFYGGVYTNAIIVLDTSGVFPQPSVIFAETQLAQTVASAPGMGGTMVAEAEQPEATAEVVEEAVETEVVEEPAETEAVEEPVETEEPTPVLVEPTPAPVEPTPVPVEPTPVPVEPTAAPVEQPTVAPTTAPVVQATPVPAGPTARVVLDPGANLNLRQFPSADALVLGQAPAGSTLRAEGREGQELDIDGQPIDPNYVDPVSLLPSEDDDLDPNETWINVTYTTPDGGQINAWVLSQFVFLRDVDGDQLPLRDLEPVPANQPGEAIDTEVTPPSAQQERVTVRIINLNQGVNLNIRRNPSDDSEILFGIPVGTVALLNGVNDTAEWAFITYEPTDGGSVNGWVSTNFVNYQLNGEVVDLAELEIQEVLEIIPSDRIGEVSADAPAQAQPTADPTVNAYVARVELDPNANLNLRRSPDSESEVLARIPAGTQIIVTSRTEDELWLETNYEGQSGWIASAFVSVTFNGVAVELAEIPVTTAETNPGT